MPQRAAGAAAPACAQLAARALLACLQIGGVIGVHAVFDCIAPPRASGEHQLVLPPRRRPPRQRLKQLGCRGRVHGALGPGRRRAPGGACMCRQRRRRQRRPLRAHLSCPSAPVRGRPSWRVCRATTHRPPHSTCAWRPGPPAARRLQAPAARRAASQQPAPPQPRRAAPGCGRPPPAGPCCPPAWRRCPAPRRRARRPAAQGCAVRILQVQRRACPSQAGPPQSWQSRRKRPSR